MSDSIIDELSVRIRSRVEFAEDMHLLRRASLQTVLSLAQSVDVADETVVKLSQCASIFASSSSVVDRNTGYEIATAIATLRPQDQDAKSLASYVFSSLGNFVALGPLGTDFGQGDRTPLSALVQSLYHQTQNTVKIPGSAGVVLTDLQREIWEELKGGSSLSITAPTSAGKSFVLLLYLVSRLLDNVALGRYRVIYLVPTRALITQVSGAIRRALERAAVSHVALTTTPVDPADDLPERVIAVWTQERLQLSLASHPDLAADLLIVDEAQVIGEGGRGVILNNVIDDLLRRNPTTQVFFASPFVENPGVLGEVFALPELDVIRAEDTSVGQNIILATTRGRRLVLEAYVGEERVPLGAIDLPRTLATQEDRLAIIPPLLADNAQSLIYARGPAEAESVAEAIAEKWPPPEVEHKARLALSQLAADVVHPKYSLVTSVLHGVGFHYGRMPAIVRKAVEESFTSGALTFLVTTSTLLHGVNLPARNIFLHKPSRGRTKGISGVDFWNLAGRAGRLGKELQGNVFLIDYDSWPDKPLVEEKRQLVRPSLSAILTDRGDEFLKYLAAKDPLPPERDDFDNAFVRLFSDQVSGRLVQTFERSKLDPSSLTAERLVTLLAEAEKQSELSPAVIAQSPTVSVYRQQRLYSALLRGAKVIGPQRFIVPHPRRADAFDRLADAMKVLHTNILDYPDEDRRHRFFAFQALLWMKGAGIPQLIERQIAFKKEKGAEYPIATAIRQTLDMIESELRFEYVRLLSCYINILGAVLDKIDRQDLSGSIAAIPLYLELGASERTPISLMSLGLSRVSAIKLSDLSNRTDMTQSAARRWLETLDTTSLKLSPFVIREIDDVRSAFKS